MPPASRVPARACSARARGGRAGTSALHAMNERGARTTRVFTRAARRAGERRARQAAGRGCGA